MRRLLALAALPVSLLLASPAAAAGTGGAVAPPRLSAAAFSAAPTMVAPGAAMSFKLRVAGARGRVRVQIDLVPAGYRTALTRIQAGTRRTGRSIVVRWAPRPGALPEGRYVARLLVRGRGTLQGGRAAALAPFQVAAAAAPPPALAAVPSGLFPVQGPYSFGGPANRFGAGRAGHTHQGQDVLAAAGTPVISPVPGTVYWSAYQAAAAGYYVVVRGVDGRDYVFMHFLAGSVAVQKGQAVAAGQLLGAVGATGDAQGPHLHFEIWPTGWYSSPTSAPIDPLPQLEAWAAA